MNEIVLRGTIHNIEYSHKIKQTNFNKAVIEVDNESGEPNFIVVKYKEQYGKYGEGDKVALKGNIRSHSYKQGEKNKTKNLTKECAWCEYRDICMAELSGGDREYVIKQ